MEVQSSHGPLISCADFLGGGGGGGCGWRGSSNSRKKDTCPFIPWRECLYPIDQQLLRYPVTAVRHCIALSFHWSLPCFRIQCKVQGSKNFVTHTHTLLFVWIACFARHMHMQTTHFSAFMINGACAHYVMVFKFQWKPFWLATQRDSQNDWTTTQNRVNSDIFAQGPLLEVCTSSWFDFTELEGRSKPYSHTKKNDKRTVVKFLTWIWPVVRKRAWKLKKEINY